MAAWTDWWKCFPGSPPVGHALRGLASDRWARFHSFSDARRTPADAADTMEVLRRYNLIATAVLGLGAEVTVWVTQYDRDDEIPPGTWVEAQKPSSWGAAPEFVEGVESATFYTATARWLPFESDELFRFSADGRLGDLTLFSGASSSAICPYEGGVDVFVRAAELVSPVKRLFREWASNLPTGL